MVILRAYESKNRGGGVWTVRHSIICGGRSCVIVSSSVSCLLATIDAITVPDVVIPETATLYVIPEPVTVPVVAPAVPVK